MWIKIAQQKQLASDKVKSIAQAGQNQKAVILSLLYLRSSMEKPAAASLELSARPCLSVVIASFLPASSVERCLKSLRGQDRVLDCEIEIIVVSAGREQELQDVVTNFSDVRFLFLPASTALPTLLGRGIEHSRGEIIALTDTVCTVSPNWVNAIFQAHRAGHDVVGGAVEMAKNEGALNCAAFFCEYGQFLKPLPAGQSTELPGNNFSFKRQLLEQNQEFAQPEFWKTYWCRSLQQQDVSLFSTSDIVVSMHKSYKLAPFLKRRFHHGRCFAGMRLGQLSTLKRACYILGSPLLPFIFARRIIGSVWPKRHYRRDFVRALPFSALAILFWCGGEFWGYLAGPGESCIHVRG